MKQKRWAHEGAELFPLGSVAVWHVSTFLLILLLYCPQKPGDEEEAHPLLQEEKSCPEAVGEWKAAWS